MTTARKKAPPPCDGVLFMAPGKTAKLTQRRYLILAPAVDGMVRWMVLDECLKNGFARASGGAFRRPGYESAWSFGRPGSTTLGAGYAAIAPGGGYVDAVWHPAFKTKADPIDMFGTEFEIMLNNVLIGGSGDDAGRYWRFATAHALGGYLIALEKTDLREIKEALPPEQQRLIEAAAENGFKASGWKEKAGWSRPETWSVGLSITPEILHHSKDVEPHFSENLPISPKFEQRLIDAGFRSMRTGSDIVSIRYVFTIAIQDRDERGARKNPTRRTRRGR